MKIEMAAADQKNGMTLDELIAFVTACQRNDVDPHEVLLGRLGWSGRVRSIRTGK